eukprot:ctg_1831.g619
MSESHDLNGGCASPTPTAVSASTAAALMRSPPIKPWPPVTPSMPESELFAFADGAAAAEVFESGATGYAYNDIILLPGHVYFAADDVRLDSRVSRSIPLKTPL